MCIWLALPSIFSPNERILLNAHGSVEQPINGKGQLYLTDRRMLLVHKSGLIIKREMPLLDVEISQISYVKTQGTLRKVLALGVKSSGGQVAHYKVHVRTPETWVAQIMNMGTNGQKYAQDPSSKACQHCGENIPAVARFCAECGRPQ